MPVKPTIFGIALLAGVATVASAAFSFVQTQKNFDNSHAGSVVVTMNAPYATGDILMVAVGIIAPASEMVSSVSATGVTFSPLKVSNTFTGSDSEIWCGHVISGGATAITVSISGTSYGVVEATIGEFSGGAGCSAESTNSNTATSNTVTTGNVTATGADLVYGTATPQNITSGPTNSFTSLATPSVAMGAAYQIESGSGTYSTGWGLASSGGWNAAIAAINPNPPISASPTTVPATHAGNMTLTLTGAGTSWTGGTVFTVSGVSNVSKVSQNVTSSTAATLVVTTGAGTGTLTISDGVNSTGIQVSTPSLTLTLAVPNTSTSTTVTFTGANTIWTRETASTLFSVTGGTGATLGTPTVGSDTSATATLITGPAAGPATINDTSVSTSQAVQLNSASGPATEAYYESTFLAGIQNFDFIQSVDGLNWSNYSKTIPVITGVRDPTVMNLGGTWAMAYNDVTQGSVSTITLYSGSSISSLAFLAYVPVYAGQEAWSPTFFRDPISPTTLYMTVSTPQLGYGVSLLSASTSNLSSWSAPAIILPFSTTGYDGSIYKVGSTYFLFYAVPGQGLYYATSNSVSGPYSGQTSVVSGNYESPRMSYSGITGYRLYFTQASGDNGGFYVQCSLSGSTFSAVGVPTRFFLNGSTETQHGTVLNYGPVVPVPGMLQ